jgi:putative addiction module component (TIGR02574 family)
MVNPALKEQALQLDPVERIELITALTDSLEGYVSPEFAAVLQSRWAEVEADPNGYVTIDDDEREFRARRSMA